MPTRHYSLEHRLEDPKTRENLQSFAPKWQPPSNTFTRDERKIHDLAPVTRLPTPSTAQEKAGKHVPHAKTRDTGKGWTIKQMRGQLLQEDRQGEEVKGVEDSFFKKVGHIATSGPESHEARRFLVHEDSELIAKMDNLDESLARRHAVLRKKLDSLGVFSKETNAIRKRAVHTVELRRRMEGNAIRRGDLGSSTQLRIPGQLDSLESKLMYLAQSIDFIDNPPQYSARSHLSDKMTPGAGGTGGTGGGGMMGRRGAAGKDKMELPPEVLEARQREAEAACAEMVSRYRQRVDDERNRILMDMGIDPASAGDLDLDALGGAAKEERGAEAKGRTSREEKRAYQATGDLVAEALARINQATKKLEDARTQATRKREEEEAQVREAEERSRYWDEVRSQRKKQASDAEAEGEGGEGGAPGAGGEGEEDVGDDGASRSARASSAGGSPRRGGRPSQGGSPSKGYQASTRGARISFAGDVGEEADAPLEVDVALGADGRPKLPPLPALLVNEGMALADLLLQRLERIWGLLRMPVMQKLDMVIKYTSRDLSPYMEEALECWEGAAACVIARERALGQLNDFQAKSLVDGVVPQHLRVVHQKLQLQLDAATEHVQGTSEKLLAEFGDQITYEGHPYPWGEGDGDGAHGLVGGGESPAPSTSTPGGPRKTSEN